MRNRSHLRELVPKSGATVPAALWSGKWIDIWPLKNRCLRFAAECRGIRCTYSEDRVTVPARERFEPSKRPISGGASHHRGLEHAARSEIKSLHVRAARRTSATTSRLQMAPSSSLRSGMASFRCTSVRSFLATSTASICIWLAWPWACHTSMKLIN